MKDYHITVNTTLKVNASKVIAFEDWLREVTEVIDFRFVPDTTDLYDSDPLFRKLVKAEKEARTAKLDYINEHWIDNLEKDED